MNYLDRIVAEINPVAGLRRVMARERMKFFDYDAATPGTKRGYSGGATKNGSPENWRTNRDRVRLMWDARDMVRNFAILKGIVSRIVQYTVDSVSYVPQTGDDVVDGEYQDYMQEWAESADITGRHALEDLVKMAFWGELVDGDHGWNMLDLDPGNPLALRIQPIEADRLGNVLNPSETNEANKIGGVIVDDKGVPVAYSIYKRNRITSQYSFDEDVPAAQFLHLFDPARVDQYRGISALASALAPARDLYESCEFERLGAKWQIGSAGFVEAADPYNRNGPDAWEGNDARTPARGDGGGEGLIQMVPAKIQRLNPGDKVQFSPGTNRPSGAFLALVQTTIREICHGTQDGYPYGFLYDISGLGGHGSRVEVAQAMRGITRNQKLISRRLLNPVRDRVLGAAIAAGRLTPHPLWRNGRWSFGATLTGDYGNDTTAHLQELNMGLTNASDLIADKGGTFEKTMRKRASEVMYLQKLASETKVPIELLTAQYQNPSQLLAAMNLPPPPPPAGLVEAQVDAKPLLEILKQVGEGRMDRESAIASIIQLYGLRRSEVEKMVPEVAEREKAET